MSDGVESAGAPLSRRPDYYTTGWTGGRNPFLLALVVSMATFMEVLDTSIANVSLPHIAGNLSVSEDESTWVLTSYLVSNAIIVPISGWLSNRFGRKRFYMTCVALFTVSSFLCGMAPTLGALIFFRVLQGVGGGGLGPSEQAILADTFPPAKRGMGMAIYGMAVVVAPALGPTLGGYITDNFSWRWIFFINVPVGLLSLTLSSRMVTDPPHLVEARKHAGGVDWVGLGLIALGLACLEVVLDKGQEDEWFASSLITGFALVSAVSLVSAVVWEWNHPNPIVDLKMFKRRSFVVSNVMMLSLGAALFGSTVLLPQFMELLMGYSAQQAGMALSPGALAIIPLLPVVGLLVAKMDARIIVALGFAMMSGSLFHMAGTMGVQMDFGTAVSLRVYQSLAMAFLFVPIQTISYSDVPLEKNNQVSGIMNLSRNLGGDVGIALTSVLLMRRAQFHQATLAAHTTAYDPQFQATLAGAAQAMMHAGAGSVAATRQATALMYRQLVLQANQLAYLDALWVLGVVCALIVPLIWFAKKPKAGMPAPAH